VLPGRETLSRSAIFLTDPEGSLHCHSLGIVRALSRGGGAVLRRAATIEILVEKMMDISYEMITTDRNYAPAEQQTARALRGDDALMRAAGEVAAPWRRLLTGLRDAHEDTTARILRLRGMVDDSPTAARLLTEAEEQLRRIELMLAHLRERPRSMLRAVPVQTQRHDAPDAWAAEERRGAADARYLQELANLAGQHLAARLLDLNAAEREAAARDLAAARRH